MDAASRGTGVPPGKPARKGRSPLAIRSIPDARGAIPIHADLRISLRPLRSHLRDPDPRRRRRGAVPAMRQPGGGQAVQRPRGGADRPRPRRRACRSAATRPRRPSAAAGRNAAAACARGWSSRAQDPPIPEHRGNPPDRAALSQDPRDSRVGVPASAGPSLPFPFRPRARLRQDPMESPAGRLPILAQDLPNDR